MAALLEPSMRGKMPLAILAFAATASAFAPPARWTGACRSGASSHRRSVGLRNPSVSGRVFRDIALGPGTAQLIGGNGCAEVGRDRTRLESSGPSAEAAATATATATAADGSNAGRGGAGAPNGRGAVARLLSRVLLVAATFLAGFRVGLGNREAVVYEAVDAASRRLPRRFPALSLLLSTLLAREAWRSVPGWAKARIQRRIAKIRGKSDAAAATEEDPDDMTSYGNVSAKLQGLLQSAEEKLPPEARIANIQAPSLALLQLAGQLKERGADERDRLYDESGAPGTAEDLADLPEGFEFADWAYDEDPDGIPLKENLERLGFCLVRHDKTTVPGFVGHYVAIHPGRKLALIGVKGTSTFEDLLTDCCGRAVAHELEGPFVPGGKKEIRCHEGILISARRLADDIQPLVKELFLPSGYKMLITGHSLGAGASALLSIIIRSRNQDLVSDLGDKLKVWAYASPPVLDFDSAVQCTPFITTIVNNSDVIPRASLSNLLILLEMLASVDVKLEEAGIRTGDKVDSIALLRKLAEGNKGEMIMQPKEMAEALAEAQSKVGLRDPDHLFVPGRVITMYSKWEEKKAEEKKVAEKKQQKDKSTDKDEPAAILVPSKEPKEYVRIADGNMKALRSIEIDQRMIEDHLSVAYRKSLKELSAEQEPASDLTMSAHPPS